MCVFLHKMGIKKKKKETKNSMNRTPSHSLTTMAASSAGSCVANPVDHSKFGDYGGLSNDWD